MKHLAFYPIIILVFYLCVPVCSGYTTFTIVSGAGTESVNGFYYNMGTDPTDSDGVDYYQKGDLYLYRAFDPDDGKAWIIGDELGSTHLDYMYYTVISSNDTPDGLTMTECIKGVETGPSLNVEKHTPSNTISVINAGTESVNGYYFNMGTDPTYSDGVDYYQKGDLYLYRADSDEGKAWIIGDELGSTHGDYWYYSVISSNNTPIGLTMTYNTSKGELPFPTIRRYGSAVSIINLLLD
ncbi:MAG TPA: hypothetical protein PK874_02755 [Desulfobacteraceae bacterium]|nr:hypothetical protein [Desulfobacteraceae bacterium]HPJ69013.1 hypothetical protein [Desulfobacteraceae bacterium]HPQ29470.1 hypothetical protein [Desulfobacteraceae bacterium]